VCPKNEYSGRIAAWVRIYLSLNLSGYFYALGMIYVHRVYALGQLALVRVMRIRAYFYALFWLCFLLITYFKGGKKQC